MHFFLLGFVEPYQGFDDGVFLESNHKTRSF
jgi:hypothetical protein